MPYDLPNLEELTVEDNDGIETGAFLDFVDEQEELSLRALMGDDLYEAFIEGISLDGELNGEFVDEWEWSEDIEERWLNLINGALYDSNGIVNRWKGLYKLLKPYIYSQYLNASGDSMSGAGVVVAKPENSYQGDARVRICAAWNEYAKLAGCEGERDSLYGFLYNSGSAYIDSIGDYTDVREYVQEKTEYPETINDFDF